MVRAITERLTGKTCDFWDRIQIDEFLYIHKCKCLRFASIGKWKYGLKTCGADSMCKKGLDFGVRFFEHIDKYKDSIIFDEGVMNATYNITSRLSKAVELYLFYMDVPHSECERRIVEERKGNIQPKYIVSKQKSMKRVFDRVDCNKWILSGSKEDNIKKVLEIIKVSPCACFQERDTLLELMS